MKKVAFVVFLMCALSFFSVQVRAVNEIYDEEYFSESIFSSIDSEVADALEEFGIDSLQSEKIYSVSFSQIAEYFSDDLKSKAKNCIKDFLSLLSMLIVIATVNAYFTFENKENLISVLGTVLITVFAVSGINPLMNMLLSTMKTNGSFMLSFIPVFTLLVSLSGSPGGAITYNTLSLFFAEGISGFINNFATPILGAFFSLSIAFSVNKTMNINRFINMVNKTVSVVIGFLACGFTGILSIKGVMSVTIDAVSSKSIRFLLSSLIPIVGSSISDAYSSLLGSINLIKGSVAMVGILVVLIISLPAIIEGFVYCISFSFLSYIAEIFGCEEISGIFRAFCSGIRTLLLLSIFEVFLLIISTGIMLTMKGGV